MTEQNTGKGIWLMILTTALFACQDGLSRYLVEDYSVMMVVMIRYWFFGAFVLLLASRKAGGIRKAARTAHPVLQIIRGTLLALEVCVMVLGFRYLGIIGTQAVFIAYPLLIAALSGPILGENVGWRRWSAIGVGFVGVLIILQPGVGVFSPAALLPLLAAVMFAVYGLLNRFVARQDGSATSFFWTGTMGALVMTLLGVWFWTPMSGNDWVWMILLSILGMLGHYLLIVVYELAEASAVQPFAYFQLGFGALVGIYFFGETLQTNVVIGAGVVIAAGLFTLWRERQKR